MKNDLLYADHIIECIRRIEEYVAGGEEAFQASTLIQDAVVRNLQILAESAKRISNSLRDQHPDIPWRQMTGFRNIAVHQYFELDLRFVWEIVTVDLPELKRTVTQLREDLSQGT